MFSQKKATWLLSALLLVSMFLLSPLASAEVKSYEGVGECAVGLDNWMTVEQTQNYVKNLAERDAYAKAGEYLKKYRPFSQLKLIDEEIFTAARGIVRLSKPTFSQESTEVNNVPVVIFKAAVKATIDTADVDRWLQTDSTQRKSALMSSVAIRREVNKLLDAVGEVTKRNNEATTRAERDEIQKEGNIYYKKLLSYDRAAEAVKLSAAGKLNEAVTVYNEALEMNPQSPTILNVAGLNYTLLGDFAKAIDSQEKAIALAPDYAMAWHNLGLVYSLRGSFDNIKHIKDDSAYISPDTLKAVECFQKAADLEPDNDFMLASLGDAYKSADKYQQAIDCYKKALKLNQNGDADIWGNLGDSYYEMKNYKEAVNAYTQALQFDPNNAKIQKRLANAHKELGNGQQALEHYQKAEALDPGQSGDILQHFYDLGDENYQQGKYKEASEYWSKLVESAPDEQLSHLAFTNLLTSYYKLGQYDKVVAFGEKYIERQPMSFVTVTIDEESRKAMAAVGINIDDFITISSDEQKALDYAQRSRVIKAWNVLGDAYRQQGNSAKAISCYQKVLSLEPNDQNALKNIKTVSAS